MKKTTMVITKNNFGQTVKEIIETKKIECTLEELKDVSGFVKRDERTEFLFEAWDKESKFAFVRNGKAESYKNELIGNDLVFDTIIITE